MDSPATVYFRMFPRAFKFLLPTYCVPGACWAGTPGKPLDKTVLPPCCPRCLLTLLLGAQRHTAPIERNHREEILQRTRWGCWGDWPSSVKRRVLQEPRGSPCLRAECLHMCMCVYAVYVCACMCMCVCVCLRRK